MRSPTANAPNPARLCALNLGIQMVWGAILAVSLQERSAALGHGDGIRAYAAIAASGALVATLVQLAAGPASDRLRRRKGNRLPFYTGGIALAVPALAWFYLAPTYGQLLGAFVLLELAVNLASGPYQAVIPDDVPAARRGAASSWMAGYQAVGNAAGLIVAGFVHDLRLVVGLLAAALVASYAVTLDQLGRLRSGDFMVAAKRPLRVFDGPLLVLLVSRGLINLGFYTVLGFLLFFVHDSLGVGESGTTTQTALIFLTFTLAAIPGAAAAARPTDRYDKRLVVTAATTVLALALGALASAAVLPVAYIAAACAGAGWGAFVTADWALAAAVLPPATMATAMGVWNVATTLPQVVAPLVTAPLVTTFGARASGLGPRAAIVLALLEIAAGTIAVWRLPRGLVSGALPER